MFPVHDDNPVESTPWVTFTILGTCVAVFLWQFLSDPMMQERILYALGVTPTLLFGHLRPAPEIDWIPSWATMFSSMFLHGSWMHLISNMMYLWVFGNNVEVSMGHLRYLVFYLLTGVAAVMAQALPDTHSEIPMVGASGAISGILGAYLLLHPRAQVLIVVPILFVIRAFRVPAMYVLGVWFLMQLFSTVTTLGASTSVAFGAHVGGFVAGMLLVGLFRKRGVPLDIPFLHFNPFQRRRG
ncbi:MAG: rhomboid family intramembrane serine protease [Gammaproteobacteria bacterium]|nr:MAG: rhomboid family intramembrane serine protease [Gammaproteobacteria bacterium]